MELRFFFHKLVTRWFQPSWNIWVKFSSSQTFGLNINIWNQHLRTEGTLRDLMLRCILSVLGTRNPSPSTFSIYFYIQIKKVKLQLKWRTFPHYQVVPPKSLWNLTFVGEGSRIAPIGGASHRNLRKVRSRKPNTSENHDDALENWSYHYFPVGSSCFFFHASCQLWNFWLQRSREFLGARPLGLRGGKVGEQPSQRHWFRLMIFGEYLFQSFSQNATHNGIMMNHGHFPKKPKQKTW